MKWYSIKKYKVPAGTICFILFEEDQFEVAMWGWHEKTKQYGFLTLEDNLLCSNVTHFCIPEPVEIEQ